MGNEVGIYFSESGPLRKQSTPSWPAPLIKKPTLALVSLSERAAPSHVCLSVFVQACLRATHGLNRRH